MKKSIILVIAVFMLFGTALVSCYGPRVLHLSAVQNPELKISNIHLFLMDDYSRQVEPYKKIIISYNVKNKTEREIISYRLLVEINYLDCTEKIFEKYIIQYHESPILPNKVQVAQINIEPPAERCTFIISDLKIYIDIVY